MVARLTHARLFGTDSPYEDRSTEEIMAEMRQIEQRYADHDSHFLFQERSEHLQLVIFNQGEEAIRDASITFVMPNHSAFHVAANLPKQLHNEKFVEATPAEQAGYPSVTLQDEAIKVSVKLDDVQPGEPVEIFDLPLRFCAGSELEGRRIGIQYSLQAQNLRAPAKGTLRLVF